MFYTLKVEWDDGDQTIEIGDVGNDKNKENSIITKVAVKFDTIDDDTNTKSSQMLARIKIEGKIPTDNQVNIFEKLSKLSDWSRDFVSRTTYRKVILTINESANNTLRQYEFENIFVRDYIEEYDIDKKDADGKFELNLTQRENMLDAINILNG